MPIHIRRLSDLVYCYPKGECYEDRPSFEGVVNLLWIENDKVKLMGANGENAKEHLAEIVDELSRLGVKTIQAPRAKGHGMPRPWKLINIGHLEDLWELNLA